MVRSIGDRLRQQAPTSFFGRRRELERLEHLLEPDAPAVTHIHGIGGIGKSSLLSAFATSAAERGIAVVRLDCSTIEPTERGFLHELNAAIPCDQQQHDIISIAEKLASFDPLIILCLDSYEVYRLMDTWLRQSFVPALPETTRVVLAGREPPVSEWLTAPGWLDAFSSLHLNPLRDTEAFEMLTSTGLGAEKAHQINRFAHGHPLALRLAAAAAADLPDLEIPDVVSGRVVETLTRMYLDDIEEPETRLVVDASCVVRRVTQPLLDAMVPEVPAKDAYGKLLALPFTDLTRDGIAIHDVVREAVHSLLIASNPDLRRRLRKSAWDHLQNELIQAGTADLWRCTADIIYLIENPVIRETCFPSGPHTIAVEPATPGDRDDLIRITERHDGPDAADLVTRAFKNRPDSFWVARAGEERVAGYYWACDPATLPRETKKEDPITAGVFKHLDTDPIPRGQSALLIRRWLDRDAGERPSEVQAACWVDIKRIYLEQRTHLRRVYVAVQDPGPYLEVLPTLGFSVADGTIPLGGRDYTTAVLDFGPTLVGGWLTRLAGAEIADAQPHLLDPQARALVLGDRRVPLTKLEFEVMQYLCEREGKVSERAALLDEIWGIDYDGASNVVDVVIRSLRKKLGDRAWGIQTVTGAGYRYISAGSTG